MSGSGTRFSGTRFSGTRFSGTRLFRPAFETKPMPRPSKTAAWPLFYTPFISVGKKWLPGLHFVQSLAIRILAPMNNPCLISGTGFLYRNLNHRS
jgi:hypothetical protein